MPTKAEELESFKRGWHDGSAAREQDPASMTWEGAAGRALMLAYQRGWNTGKDARTVALFDYCERIQYDAKVRALLAPPAEMPGG